MEAHVATQNITANASKDTAQYASIKEAKEAEALLNLSRIERGHQEDLPESLMPVGKTGVTADRDKIEFRLFVRSLI